MTRKRVTEGLGSESFESESPGHESPGHESPGHESPGHESPGHESPGRESPGRESLGREASGSLDVSERPKLGGGFGRPRGLGRTLGRTSENDRSKKGKAPARSLRSRALSYLSRREHSRAELARKLKPFAEASLAASREAEAEAEAEFAPDFDEPFESAKFPLTDAKPESLDALLDALQAEGWLSDDRFAHSVVHRRAARFGATRIVGELRRHAVADELIAEVGAGLRETEWSRAHAVWQRKYGAVPASLNERVRQTRFLASRGFSQSIISRLLKGLGAPDDDSVEAVSDRSDD